MPGRHPAPNIMWAGAVDCTSVYQTDALQRGEDDPVQLPDPWYEDLVDLMNGRGSVAGQGLLEQCAIGGGFGAYVDATDRFLIYGPAGTPFSLDAMAGNAAFGFDPAGQASVLVDGQQVVRAAREWQRINPVISATIRIRVDASTWTLPQPAEYYAQDVLTVARSRGSADDDDPTTTSLEALDNTASDPVNKRIRWGVDAVGHAWTAYPSTIDPITWQNATLQRLLGFRDDDAPVDIPGTSLKLYRASDPAAPALVPSRPAGPIIEGFDELRYGGDLTDGDAVSHIVYAHMVREVAWYLDGPDDLNSLASHFDHRHQATWRHQVTLYQQWPGEIRRALPDGVRIRTGRPAYDTAYTSEDDGGRGRYICTRATSNGSNVRRSWTGAHRRKGEMRTVLNIRRRQWP